MSNNPIEENGSEEDWESEGGAPVREPVRPKNPPQEGGAEVEPERELVSV